MRSPWSKWESLKQAPACVITQLFSAAVYMWTDKVIFSHTDFRLCVQFVLSVCHIQPFRCWESCSPTTTTTKLRRRRIILHVVNIVAILCATCGDCISLEKKAGNENARQENSWLLCSREYTIDPALSCLQLLEIRSGLRSAESTDYITPRLNSKFGERSFSHAGPASWNSLPADLRAISDCHCFKSKLKTYLFQSAFNIQ